MSAEKIEQKLSAARTRLIIDKPFLGALTLRLPLQAAAASWCPTTATDARKLYYNPEYIEKLSLSQTQFILAHEALHCALSHFARRQHRVKQRWDLACDYAVNPLLLNDGLQPPPDALLEDSYQGMTAEEIYPFIEENSEECTLDKHLYDAEEDGGQGNEQDQAQNEKDIQRQQQAQNQQNKQDSQQPSTQQTKDQSNSSSKQPSKQQPDNQDQGSDSELQQNRGQGAEPDNHSAPQETQSAPVNKPQGRQQTSDTPAQQQQPQPQPPEPPQSQTDIAMQAPAPLKESEREELKVQWQQRLAGAAQQAQQAGKLGSAMARLVDHLLQPQLPWRSLLAHYVTCSARDDYSYVRPNTRRGNPAIFPGLRSEEIDIAVVLDSSGSIKPQEMQEFLSEINAIKSQLRARIVFNSCDAQMNPDGPWIFEAWEEFSLPKSIAGGGATDFRPAFDWIQSLDVTPSLLVYFTDAEGEFPQQMPAYPVIWLVKGKRPVPWGQRVQLN